MPTAAGIDYREQGSGRPVVFVHGVGVNGLLWRDVAPRVAEAGYRCISPDLPMGAHSRPMPADADLSLPGLAGIVADFLDELGLEDVVIVANDTGGAVAQWLVGRRADRIGALVLTSCDAFEVFPPKPQLYLIPAARIPGALWLVGQLVRWRWVQRTPFAYGWTTRSAMPEDVMRSFTGPVRTIAGVRRDLKRLLLDVDKQYTFEAAESLRSFDKPALVVWGDQDKLFPREHGERMAELLPQGRFELMPDSRCFVPMEQPAALAERIVEFLAEAAPRSPGASRSPAGQDLP